MGQVLNVSFHDHTVKVTTLEPPQFQTCSLCAKSGIVGEVYRCTASEGLNDCKTISFCTACVADDVKCPRDCDCHARGEEAVDEENPCDCCKNRYRKLVVSKTDTGGPPTQPPGSWGTQDVAPPPQYSTSGAERTTTTSNTESFPSLPYIGAEPPSDYTGPVIPSWPGNEERVPATVTVQPVLPNSANSVIDDGDRDPESLVRAVNDGNVDHSDVGELVEDDAAYQALLTSAFGNVGITTTTTTASVHPDEVTTSTIVAVTPTSTVNENEAEPSDFIAEQDAVAVAEPTTEAKGEQTTCPLCFGEPEELVTLSRCGHKLCRECLDNTVSEWFKDLSKYPMRCPAVHHCPQQLRYREVQMVLSPEELDTYDEMVVKAASSDMSSAVTITCCNKTCENGILIDKQRIRQTPRTVCPYCRVVFCASCMIEWHEGRSCEEVKGGSDAKRNDDLLKVLMKSKKWSQCPVCQIPVEKTAGCNHMTHKRCRGQEDTHFCACCSVQLQPGHYHFTIDDTDRQHEHFPKGVFKPCIDAPKPIQERDEHYVDIDQIERLQEEERRIRRENERRDNERQENERRENERRENERDDDCSCDGFTIAKWVVGVIVMLVVEYFTWADVFLWWEWKSSHGFRGKDGPGSEGAKEFFNGFIIFATVLTSIQILVGIIGYIVALMKREPVVIAQFAAGRIVASAILYHMPFFVISATLGGDVGKDDWITASLAIHGILGVPAIIAIAIGVAMLAKYCKKNADNDDN